VGEITIAESGKPLLRRENFLSLIAAQTVSQKMAAVIGQFVENRAGMWQRTGFMIRQRAKYNIGQVVRHRRHPFRGVVFDVDPEFNNTEEWYEAIPEDSRPAKKQPYYHLLAENEQSFYVAYVSEQNLIADYSGEPVEHPDVPDLFGAFEDGSYELHFQYN